MNENRSRLGIRLGVTRFHHAVASALEVGDHILYMGEEVAVEALFYLATNTMYIAACDVYGASYVLHLNGYDAVQIVSLAG